MSTFSILVLFTAISFSLTYISDFLWTSPLLQSPLHSFSHLQLFLLLLVPFSRLALHNQHTPTSLRTFILTCILIYLHTYYINASIINLLHVVTSNCWHHLVLSPCISLRVITACYHYVLSLRVIITYYHCVLSHVLSPRSKYTGVISNDVGHAVLTTLRYIFNCKHLRAHLFNLHAISRHRPFVHLTPLSSAQADSVSCCP